MQFSRNVITLDVSDVGPGRIEQNSSSGSVLNHQIRAEYIRVSPQPHLKRPRKRNCILNVLGNKNPLIYAY